MKLWELEIGKEYKSSCSDHQIARVNSHGYYEWKYINQMGWYAVELSKALLKKEFTEIKKELKFKDIKVGDVLTTPNGFELRVVTFDMAKAVLEIREAYIAYTEAEIKDWSIKK